MRSFNIVYGNHGSSPVHIDDLISYLACAFADVGSQVDISPGLSGRAINIVIECFDEQSTSVILDAIRSGVRVFVVATEHLTNGTFNDFNVSGASHYSARDYWLGRYRNFVQVAREAAAVWCVARALCEPYRRLLGDKVSCIPLGYVEGYANVVHRPDREKNIDFLFTGSMTARREMILNAFRQTGVEVAVFPPQTPVFIRQNVVARSRVCLALAQSEEWRFKSDYRAFYHLMNGSFIVAEDLPEITDVDDYVQIVAKRDYLARCVDYLRSGSYSAIARMNLARFREERPLRPLFIEALGKNV